jgi:glycosyltransferase involved in cell wall biosynthesis
MSQRSLQFGEIVFRGNSVKLSLCITVKNERESVVPLLESLFAQSRVPEEIVIVDGGSTDGTIDILKRYGDRVRWVSEPDEGHADAINKGWKMSRGKSWHGLMPMINMWFRMPSVEQ